MGRRLNWTRDAERRRVDASRRVEEPESPLNRVTWWFDETGEDREYLYLPVRYVWRRNRRLCLRHYDPHGRSRYDRFIRSLLEEETAR